MCPCGSPTFGSSPATWPACSGCSRRPEEEILLGGDDRHRDFRASMLLQRDATRTSAVLTTVVHFNNGLGRAYFFVVRPFHRLIVMSLLRNVARQFDGEQLAHAVDM